MAKYISSTLTAVTLSLLGGCVTQSFENNEPIVKTQANRDEMAATRISLGLGYLKMGDMSQAKLNLEKAKRFSPNLVQVHTAFAHYYETVGENQLAIESFEQALSLKADSADTLNNYGVFLCRQDKVEAAEKQFLKAIAVPSYLLVAQSYENLASCYLESDNFEKAEMYLNKAIFHSPNRTQTLLQMVRLQYAMGDYKKGKIFLQKFERNTQRFSADSLALAYKLYRKLGQRRTASNYGNMLVKMYPQSWEGKQYLLNELEFIDADNLARKYQMSKREQDKTLAPTSKKRVVKLSPKKSNNSLYTQSVNSTVAKQQETVSVTKQTVADIEPVATPKNTTSAVLTDSASLVTAGTTSAKVVSDAAVASVAATQVAKNTPAELTLESKPLAMQEHKAMALEDNAKHDSTIDTKVVEEAIASEAALIAPHTPDVTAQHTTTSIEPTSTVPIPAKRDEPLPEAFSVEAATNTQAEEIVAKKPTKDTLGEKLVDESLSDAVPFSAERETQSSSDKSVTLAQALHTVSSGENLYNISVKYNVKLKALRKWNDIDETNKIRIGDKLYVVDPQTVNND